ncbi:glutathione S-transferase family protein [Siccirubricoccus sp. G192]|uniref:glutathione S-transferase family protein n=1 Tax=Siccirubricoccus sp. G192 TaxID=2849651 RepID=UPI001C2C68DF|nr:glutathione S-transferase family protein [Siccirubricoccus sp. G192]MBV1798242.1 glutathione S-transferase family protein [Siccirubricoccus sp. G192]
MSRILYDLAGADPERRFSPFCWRSRLALAHKGLAVETIPWHFTEKEKIALSGQGLVPVLVDDGRVVHDSWAIACWLEEEYPNRPLLFGGAGGRAMARFLNSWADGVLHPGVARLVVADIASLLAPADQAYFRESRERRFGMTLEQVVAERERSVEGFRRDLLPLRLTLRAQPWLGGEAPNYADYIVFGAFQWARVCSPFPLLAADDPVAEWRSRMLDLFGGLARATPGHDL